MLHHHQLTPPFRPHPASPAGARADDTVSLEAADPPHQACLSLYVQYDYITDLVLLEAP